MFLFIIIHSKYFAYNTPASFPDFFCALSFHKDGPLSGKLTNFLLACFHFFIFVNRINILFRKKGSMREGVLGSGL